jgi:hypothetical protein
MYIHLYILPYHILVGIPGLATECATRYSYNTIAHTYICFRYIPNKIPYRIIERMCFRYADVFIIHA